MTADSSARASGRWEGSVKYDAGNPTSVELLMTSTGGTNTCKLELFGYYMGFRQEKEKGKLILVGTVRAYVDITGDPAPDKAFAVTTT